MSMLMYYYLRVQIAAIFLERFYGPQQTTLNTSVRKDGCPSLSTYSCDKYLLCNYSMPECRSEQDRNKSLLSWR